MFGYIRPAMGGLTEEQKNIFQGYYCGLCKSIRNRFNQKARLTLSFDCTFLAMVLDSIDSEENLLTDERCIKKRQVIYNQIMDQCADVNILLAYYNILDDEKDEKSIKAKSAKALLFSSYEKARSSHLFLDTLIEEYMQKIWDKEREKCDDDDVMGDLFGQLLAGIVDMMTDNEDVVQLFYHLGRYIYLLDAVDDFDKDIKSGEYNVFVQRYGQCEDILEKVQFNLECSLSKIDEQYRKLNILKNKEVLDNIIYIGIIQYFVTREEVKA